MLTKYNNLHKKYDEIVTSRKSLETSNKKLKIEHIDLKYQELELAYNDIDPSINELPNIDIVKVNASTSCDDLLGMPYCSSCDIILSSKINHRREQELKDHIGNLNSCVAWLIKGSTSTRKSS